MAELTEAKIFEALGLGENVQEPAEPAVDQEEAPEGAEGAQAQEPAEPAAQPGEEDTPDGGEPAPAPMSEQERRANAARRRQQEQQAAIDQAVQAALEQERAKQADAMSAFFARAGLKNTVTGQPITNMDQFNDWNRQFEDQRIQRDLKAGKLNQETLNAVISSHPDVVAARELMAREAEAQQRREEAAARERLDAEIEAIHKLDASVSSLEDLMQAPYWPQLYAMTQRGYSIKDAHFLLRHEQLEAARTQAATRQALNNARGKNHMTGPESARGAGLAPVPREELVYFRALNPGLSDSDYQAYYNKIRAKR